MKLKITAFVLKTPTGLLTLAPTQTVDYQIAGKEMARAGAHVDFTYEHEGKEYPITARVVILAAPHAEVSGAVTLTNEVSMVDCPTMPKGLVTIEEVATDISYEHTPS